MPATLRDFYRLEAADRICAHHRSPSGQFRALSRGPKHFEVFGRHNWTREPGRLFVPQIWGGANDSVRARSGGQTEGHGEHFWVTVFCRSRASSGMWLRVPSGLMYSR